MALTTVPATTEAAHRGSMLTPPGRLARSGVRLGTGLAAAASMLLSAGATTQAADLSLPAVTGPLPIGRIEISLTDPTRQDPFASDGRNRELAVWVWYPARPGSTGDVAPYLPPTWAALANGAGVVTADLTRVGTNAVEGAPLDGRPRVVVLMPGLGQPVAAYSALAEDLASRGWAVVGINPSGSTSVVVFPDGHVVPATPAGTIDPSLLSDLPGWSAAAERITTAWVDDIAFVTGALGSEPPAIGALDLDHVVYVGHSLGGAAAFQACAEDAGCAAAVDLDGTLWTEVRHTGLTAPSLLLQHEPAPSCDPFCTAAEADFAVVEVTGPATRASIAGSHHLDFTDLGLLGPTPALDLGTIDPERMTAIVRDLVGAFLDEHAREAAAGTFDATAARYPEAR